MTQDQRAGISFGRGQESGPPCSSTGCASPLFPKVFHDVVDQLQHVVGGELGAAGGGFAAELGPVLARKDEERHLVPAFPDQLQQFVSARLLLPRPMSESWGQNQP